MAGTHSVFLDIGLAMLLVVHFVALLWALSRCCRAQTSARVAARERAEERGGLSAEEIRKLPCHECKEGPGGECAVCLEAFCAGDRCKVLPGCEHGFHAVCVDSWLRKSRRCPICRAEVVVAGQSKNAGVVETTAAVEIVSER
jgi:hypothetical protein